MDPSLTEKFITTKVAGEFSGYSSDYLSRLVRSKKIIGKRIGRNWIIDKESLTHFVNEQGNYKIDRARDLASARAKEYRAHRSLLHRTTKSLTTQISVPEKFSLASSSLSSHASAFAVAFAVIASGIFAAQAALIPQLARDAASLAREAASGFDAAFGGIPADIASRIDAADDAMRSVSPRLRETSAIDFTNSAAASLATVTELDFSSLRMAADIASSDIRAIALASTTPLEEPVRAAIEQQTITYSPAPRSFGEMGRDTISFLVSPSRMTSALKNAYVGIGERLYGGINASFTVYDSLIERSGADALALAAAARDTLAATPDFITKVNLALGTSIIAASHAAIRADTAIAYWAAAAAPASARTTVAIIGDTGDALARATADVAQEAPASIARTLRTLSDAGPALAQAVFNAEYAMATRFVAITGSVTDGYARALHRLGEAGYESALGAHHAVRFAAALPATVHDAYLGALGKSAQALENLGSTEYAFDAMKHIPLLAAALSGLSLGEQAALATYETIRGVFDSANNALVAFFTTTPPLVLPNGVPKARVITIATSTKPATTPYNLLPTTSYPTYTTVVQGISADVLNRSLASLRTEMVDAIAAQVRPVAAQTVTNASTIQQVNMIQDLSNLIVRNGDFRGGKLTDASSVSANSGSFTTLTGGNTVISGDLTVSGTFSPATISANSSVSSPYFIATSTTATSTFAGSLAIGTTTPYGSGFLTVGTSSPLLYIDSNTGNVGIGTSSPAFALDVNGIVNATSLYVNGSPYIGSQWTTSGSDIYYTTGAVGIGTTSPYASLSLAGTAGGTTNLFAISTSTSAFATSTALSIDSNGNLSLLGGTTLSVGVTSQTNIAGDGATSTIYGPLLARGTSSQGSSLVLQRGNSNGDNTLAFNDQTGTPLLKLYTSGNTGYSYLNGYQTYLSLGTSAGGEALRIDTSNNVRFTANIIPSANQTYNIGSPSVYWNNGYVNNIVANNLSSASTSIAGTNNTSFSINSNNPTTDTQDMSLIFYRGAGALSNGVLSWNSTLKRFEFNQNLYLANADTSTASTTLRVAAVAGQTGALTSWLDSSGNVLNTITAGGNVGIGSTTPSANLSIQNNYGSTNSKFFSIASSTSADGSTATSLFSITKTNSVATLLFPTWGITSGEENQSYAEFNYAGAGGWQFYSHSGVNKASIYLGNYSNNGQHNLIISGGITDYSNPNEIAAQTINNGQGRLVITANPYTATQTGNPVAVSILPTYNQTSGTAANTDLLIQRMELAVGSGSQYLLDAQVGNGTATSSKFVITNAGNVGVGTGSPSTPDGTNAIESHIGTAVSVYGDNPAISLISNTTTSGKNSSIFFGRLGGSSNPYRASIGYNQLNDSLGIYTGGLTAYNWTDARITVLSGGNVGIGATTPNAKLSVKGAGSTTGVNFQTTNSSDSPLFTILDSGSVGVGSTTPWGQLSVNPNGITGPSFVVGSSTATNFIVTNAGKVGIGTTDPTTSLTIVDSLGTNKVNGAGMSIDRAVAYFGNVQAGQQFRITSDDFQLWNQANSGSAWFTATAGKIGIGTTTSWGQLSASSTSAYPALAIDQHGAGAAAIFLGGNVGIGTTSPLSSLSIQGVGATSGTSALNVTNSNGASELFVRNDGNVGIGTTSPSNLLTVSGGVEVNGAGTVTFGHNSNAFFDYGNGRARIQSFGTTNTTAGGFEIILRSGDLSTFKEAFLIDSSGNIGIGTTTPFAALQVATTTGKNLVLSDSGAGADLKHWLFSSLGGSLYIGTTTDSYATSSPSALTILNNGNVGIGTTSPFTTLGVVGTARFKSTTDSANALVVENSTATSTFAVSTLDTSDNIFSVASSTGDSYLEITASGNVGIGTTSPTMGPLSLASGAYVTTGGVWTNASDRNLKTNFVAQNPQTILGKIATLPITQWNYKNESASTTHIGPVAQDFYAIFGLGGGETSISTIDPAGVALLGIQALDARTKFISNAATSTVLTVDVAGNIGIGTTTPNHTLTVAGDVAAIAFVNTSTREAKRDISYVSASSTETILNQLVNLKVATYRYKIENQDDPLRLGFIAEEAQSVAPEVLSIDGKGVDLYKLATFTLAGVQALAAKVGVQETRLTSLEDRMAKIESGAISVSTTSPLSLSTTSLASALEGFGVLIQKGIAQFNTLVFRQLVASKDADGTSSAGSVIIPVGSALAQVSNSLVLPSTKIFVTFNSSVAGSWWVSDKTAGSFRVVLAAPQATDVSFDYFLVQTEGQIATSTPATYSSQPATSGTDTTPPVITMLGANPMHLSVGDVFAEPGVTVIDAVDGTIPYSTFVNGIEQEASSATIDTSSQISYIITYSAADAAGNMSTATRSVIVGDTSDATATSTPPASDTTAPVVTLAGAAALELAVGDTFIDPGATALDDIDGDLTASIVVTGAVDTATTSTATLTYTATDAAGNIGSASRLVTVAATTTPI